MMKSLLATALLLSCSASLTFSTPARADDAKPAPKKAAAKKKAEDKKPEQDPDYKPSKIDGTF